MLSDEQFKRARELALSLAGIELVERHKDLLHSRSRRQGLNGPGLENLLTAAEQNNPEATRKLIGLLTTKHTGFFRHPEHFKAAADHVRLVAQVRGKAHLWSCGAATGEEPYSLAISLIETFDRDDAPVSILATDVDSESLKRAETGEYPASIEAIEPVRRARFFDSAGDARTIAVAPSVRRLITFRRLNLADQNWQLSGLFDVIFCRNVIMYMESARRTRILEQMIDHLAPEGLFIIDPVENLGSANANFVQQQPGIYSVRGKMGGQK